ncbi:MAG: putative lipid II flippase FtsW [Microbacteriaceae bacterium]|nr:putative lipid II flippase FtsW [Microbacteriaceae bacterium]
MTTLRPPSRRSPEPQEPASRERRGFAAVVPITRMFSPENRDSLLLIGVTLFLVAFGLVMVLSASSVEEQSATGDPFGRVIRQAVFAAVAIPLMLIVGRLPVAFWRRWAWPAVLIAGGMQLLVFVPGIGSEDSYNRNWLYIGSFSVQPSEFLKLALVVWIGVVLGRRAEQLDDWRRLVLPVGPIAGLAIGLVLIGNDLGTSAIMFMIVFACALFAGAKLSHLVLGGLGVVIVALVVAFSNQSRAGRLGTFFEGCTDDDYAGYCWQSMHGMWALASGGVLGVGLGNSRSKWNWLPEADSDYIFAIIGEELGLVGALVVLVLYALMAIVLVRIARRARESTTRIVTGGVLVWVVGQAFVNIGVVLGVLPVLGVPLPLISSGGSSLIAVLLAIGVVLSLARAETQNAQRIAAQAPLGAPGPRRPGRR